MNALAVITMSVLMTRNVGSYLLFKTISHKRLASNLPTRSISLSYNRPLKRYSSQFVFSATKDSNDSENSKLPDLSNPKLAPSNQEQPTNTDMSNSSNNNNEMMNLVQSKSSNSTTATTGLLINQHTKRILIEELGYKRKDVDILRPELAMSIVSKRIYRPEDGLPSEWKMEESTSSMIQRLQAENKYPLKYPLLGISLILLLKGFGDLVITLIKVNLNFANVSLMDEFMGINILVIDIVCMIVGFAIGSLTWKTMND